MGLDAWGVKLKPGVPIHLVNWDTIEDLDETDILPQSNYFYKHAYSRIHQSFINYVIKESGASLEFAGKPCCSMDVMNEVSFLLNNYIDSNSNDIYTWDDMDGKKRVLSKKEVHDLCEYLMLLNENGFVMWFSF